MCVGQKERKKKKRDYFTLFFFGTRRALLDRVYCLSNERYNFNKRGKRELSA